MEAAGEEVVATAVVVGEVSPVTTAEAAPAKASMARLRYMIRRESI